MIIDVLRRRASTRSFTGQTIPEDVLSEILEAGRLSPSGGNEQPWLFGLVTDRSLIQAIAETARKQRWIADAAALIVLCTKLVGDDRGGRDTQKLRFPTLADQIDAMPIGLFHALNQEEHQTKIAGSHMALVALERGVGSCWVSHFDVSAVSRILNLPRGCMASELLVLGYSSKDTSMRTKKDLGEVAFRDTYVVTGQQPH